MYDINARKYSKYWEIYAQNTSIHGFREIFDAADKKSRMFWVAALIFSTAFTGLLVYCGVSNFLREPVSTAVLRSEVGPVHLDLLFCPARWVNADKLKTYNVSMRHLFFALSHLLEHNSPQIKCKQIYDADNINKFDVAYQIREMLKIILPKRLSSAGITNSSGYKFELMRHEAISEYFLSFVPVDDCALVANYLVDKEYAKIIDLLWQQVRFNQPPYFQYKLQDAANISLELATFLAKVEAIGSDQPAIAVIRLLLGQALENVTQEQDERACQLAPLMCPSDKGDRNLPRFFRSDLPLSMRDVEALDQIASAGNENALFSHVQMLFQAHLARKNTTHATQSVHVMKPEILQGYQTLLVEQLIMDVYSVDYAPKYDHIPFSKLAAVNDFDAYATRASLAHYGRPGKWNGEVLESLNITVDVPEKHYEIIRKYVKMHAAYQQYLTVSNQQDSEASFRYFLGLTDSTMAAKLKLVLQIMHDALNEYARDVEMEYQHMLRARNFSNTFEFLRAVTVEPSQFITALTISDYGIIYPTVSSIATNIQFTQHGACFRFDVNAHLEHEENAWKAQKVRSSKFSDKVSLLMYYANNPRDLGSFDRDYDLVYFGKQAFEHLPANALRIDHNWSFTPLVSEVNVSVTQLQYQQKVSRQSHPCVNAEAQYTVRNCIADCNNQYTDGAEESKAKKNRPENHCFVAREASDFKNSTIQCSYFYYLQHAVCPASSIAHDIDWQALQKCYEQCKSPCKQWHLKTSYGTLRVRNAFSHADYEEASEAQFEDEVHQVGNKSNVPVAISENTHIHQLWRLEMALINADRATDFTLLNVEIDTDIIKYVEQLTFTWDALFGIVGGQIGLVMGASLLSFVQMGYLLYVAWKQS